MDATVWHALLDDLKQKLITHCRGWESDWLGLPDETQAPSWMPTFEAALRAAEPPASRQAARELVLSVLLTRTPVAHWAAQSATSAWQPRDLSSYQDFKLGATDAVPTLQGGSVRHESHLTGFAVLVHHLIPEA